MKKIACLIATMVALSPVTASANFIENRASWNELSAQQKEGYAVGVFDALLFVYQNNKDLSAAALGRLDCAGELAITGPDLSKMISDAYARDTANWQQRPSALLYTETYRTCKTYIDAERVKLGLKVIP